MIAQSSVREKIFFHFSATRKQSCNSAAIHFCLTPMLSIRKPYLFFLLLLRPGHREFPMRLQCSMKKRQGSSKRSRHQSPYCLFVPSDFSEIRLIQHFHFTLEW